MLVGLRATAIGSAPFLWLVVKILALWINPGGTLGNILNTVTLWMLSTKRFFLGGRSLEMNWVLSEEHTQEAKWSFLKAPKQCPVPQEGGDERLWMSSLISGDPSSSVFLHWETRQTVHCEHNSVALEFFRNSYLFTSYCVFMYKYMNWWNFHTARVLAFMCFLCQLFKKFSNILCAFTCPSAQIQWLKMLVVLLPFSGASGAADRMMVQLAQNHRPGFKT